jgi:hypothetical protein
MEKVTVQSKRKQSSSVQYLELDGLQSGDLVRIRVGYYLSKIRKSDSDSDSAVLELL